MATRLGGWPAATQHHFSTSKYFVNQLIYFGFTDVRNFLRFRRLVFKNISKLMGGRVRLMMSGGAPLSPDTHEQIKVCLCVDVIQGYGLTETTSGATVMDGKLHWFS